MTTALYQTANQGQPPDHWEIRDVDGNLLDLDRTIEPQFPASSRVFLNVKAGIGGEIRAAA